MSNDAHDVNFIALKYEKETATSTLLRIIFKYLTQSQELKNLLGRRVHGINSERLKTTK